MLGACFRYGLFVAMILTSACLHKTVCVCVCFFGFCFVSLVLLRTHWSFVVHRNQPKPIFFLFLRKDQIEESVMDRFLAEQQQRQQHRTERNEMQRCTTCISHVPSPQQQRYPDNCRTCLRVDTISVRIRLCGFELIWVDCFGFWWNFDLRSFCRYFSVRPGRLSPTPVSTVLAFFGSDTWYNRLRCIRFCAGRRHPDILCGNDTRMTMANTISAIINFSINFCERFRRSTLHMVAINSVDRNDSQRRTLAGWRQRGTRELRRLCVCARTPAFEERNGKHRSSNCIENYRKLSCTSCQECQLKTCSHFNSFDFLSLGRWVCVCVSKQHRGKKENEWYYNARKRW